MASWTAVLVTILIVFCAPALQKPSDDKVLIGFYSESLCPDCIAFATGPLNEAFKELVLPDVGTIFTLNYVPWGNAEITRKGEFECQHGKMECTINTVEACVLHYYPNQTEFWPFIHCMDSHGEAQDLTVAEKCANDQSMNWSTLDACTTGELGHKLELAYANETASLKPPHRYTPWITINGEHDSKAEGSGLIRAVCEAYTGEKPQACNK